MEKYLSNKIKNISLILTFLVVVLHAYNLDNSEAILSINYFIQNFISYGICTIAVPMFFMISGYLFFYKFNPTLHGWINKYKKRFKSLVIPFVIWCVGWMIVLYLVQLTDFGKVLFSNMIVSEFSLKQLFEYTFKYPISFQLWYISDLIKLVIISPIIYYIVKLVGRLYAPIIIGLFFINIVEFPITFFSLGCYLAIYYFKLDLKIKKSITISIAIGFVLMCIIRSLIPVTEINISDIVLNIIRVSGILSIWFGYDLLSENKNRIFRFSEYGIFIYFFHEPLQSFLYRIIFKFTNRSILNEIILYFFVPIITIIKCIIVGRILKQYFQKIYYILTGGR